MLISRSLCVLLVLAMCGEVCAAYEPSADNDTREVVTLLTDWVDAKRSDRKVPMKIYYPRGTDACATVIFSHGLGGTRSGYEFLGSYWASHGYVSVHVQHIGSDDSAWKDVPLGERMAAMKKAASDATLAMQRPADVKFAIDTLEKLNADEKSPLHKRIDMSKLGMAGHSFGAWTTLAVGGLTFGRLGQAGADKRIKAMIPMSAPVPRDPATYAESYAKVTIPALHMTGTLDESPVNDTKATDRRVPFDHSPAKNGADTYLIIFDGGDHMVFSGQRGRLGGGGDPKKDSAFHKIIRRSSLAFLDAYLRDNADAKTWLQQEAGLKAAIGKDGTLEIKK